MVIKLSGRSDTNIPSADEPTTVIDKGAPTDNAVVKKSGDNNVSIEGGKQIIEIEVNGGYSPQKSVAKAGIPTIVRFITNNTFDCSSAIRIQSLGISKNLPNSGSTDVEIGVPQSGTLKGSCGMGMYPFQIEFN